MKKPVNLQQKILKHQDQQLKEHLNKLTANYQANEPQFREETMKKQNVQPEMTEISEEQDSSHGGTTTIENKRISMKMMRDPAIMQDTSHKATDADNMFHDSQMQNFYPPQDSQQDSSENNSDVLVNK